MPITDDIAVVPCAREAGASNKRGTIIRVHDDGLCFIQENHSRRRYVFTFDKIAGYCGQSPHELGLCAGRELRFLAAAEQVELVYVCLAPPHRQGIFLETLSAATDPCRSWIPSAFSVSLYVTVVILAVVLLAPLSKVRPPEHRSVMLPVDNPKPAFRSDASQTRTPVLVPPKIVPNSGAASGATAQSQVDNVDVGLRNRPNGKVGSTIGDSASGRALVAGLSGGTRGRKQLEPIATIGPHGTSPPLLRVVSGVAAAPPLDDAARLEWAPAPSYNREARLLNLTGEVVLEVELTASGEAHVVRVRSGLGHGLDEAAIDAVKQARFQPAMKAGRPVDVMANIAVVFKPEQSDQTRPAGLPTDWDIVAYSNRAEAAMLSTLRDVTPVVEAYFQQFVPAEKVGYELNSDSYVLGRFNGGNGPWIEDLLGDGGLTNAGGSSKSFRSQQLLDGLLQVMTPDWKQLGLDRYEYKFVKMASLGAVRCLVYDVEPLASEEGGFRGRVYVEDKSWNIVRFTGVNQRLDTLFAALRNKNNRFRIDSWRVNVTKNRWMPAYTYVEEIPPLDAPELPLVKGQIRFWGYDRPGSEQQQQFTDVMLNESPPTGDPQHRLRSFENEAEKNVLARLYQGRFLGAPGEVEKSLDQIVTNLMVTNKRVLGQPVHCRVLLTTPLEAFTVGNTIVVSRGLIDVLPSESAIALVLAHQLAHIALGDRNMDTRLALADRLRITDAELLAKLHFSRSGREEEMADAKAMEMLELSLYKNTMLDAVIAMRALQAHVRQLPNLIRPYFAEHVADVEGVARDNQNFRTVPGYDQELIAKGAALPLGSKLVVNPWNGRVQLFQAEPPAASALHDRTEFAVKPFMPFLDYATEKSSVAKPSSGITRRGPRKSPTAKQSVPPVKKGH